MRDRRFAHRRTETMGDRRSSTRWVTLGMVAMLIVASTGPARAADISTYVLVETRDGGSASSSTGLSEVVGARTVGRADASISGSLGNVRVFIRTDRELTTPPPPTPNGGAVQAQASFADIWTSGAAVGSGTGAPLGVNPVLNVHGFVDGLPNGDLRIQYTIFGQIADTRFSPPSVFLTFPLLDVRLTAFDGSADLEGEICTDTACNPITIAGPSFAASIPLPTVSIGSALATADATYGPLGIPVAGSMVEIGVIHADMDPDPGQSGLVDFFNTLKFGLQATSRDTEGVWVSDSGRILVPAQTADHAAPTTAATPLPAPNAAGWNNTNVTVALNAQDEAGGSGVKEIHYASSGAQTGGGTINGASGLVAITAEGTTTLTYFAIDNAGNQETAKTHTIRIDKTAPVIAGLPADGCTLWPPKHALVTVATVSASDALAGVGPGSAMVTATSSEAPLARGSGQTSPDVVINGTTVQLRAERAGNGPGRVYTLTARAVDLAGNVATATAKCTVPHDQGH